MVTLLDEETSNKENNSSIQEQHEQTLLNIKSDHQKNVKKLLIQIEELNKQMESKHKKYEAIKVKPSSSLPSI